MPRGSYDHPNDEDQSLGTPGATKGLGAAQSEKRRMSKVRINDLAREMEVKSRQILDVLGELGLGEGKTHSSSIEDHEAEKVRAQFQHGRQGSHGGAGSSRASQGITPKIDLSHVSKPGDVMKAILAKKQEQEAEARKSHVPPSKAATPVARQGSCQTRASRRFSCSTASGLRAARASQDCAATAACPGNYSTLRAGHRVEATGWGCCSQGACRGSPCPPCYGCSAHRGCEAARDASRWSYASAAQGGARRTSKASHTQGCRARCGATVSAARARKG